MKTMSREIISGKPDGATSYFVLSRDRKLTFKQKIQKTRFQLRKKWIEKHISAGGHTMDEVCQYVQEKYGFREVTGKSAGIQYEYEEMRASFMITHALELLGKYAKHPELKGHSEEEIREFMAQVEAIKEVAKNVPKEKFDIDFHKFEKKIGDDEMHITRFPIAPCFTNSKIFEKLIFFKLSFPKICGISSPISTAVCTKAIGRFTRTLSPSEELTTIRKIISVKSFLSSMGTNFVVNSLLPQRSSSIDTPNVFASFGNKLISGQVISFSHLLTA